MTRGLAAALRRRFLRRLDSPGPYRPGHDRSGAGTDDVLQRLADIANQVGLTAGDAAVITNELLDLVDRHRSYKTALVELLNAVAAGRVTTVRGHPLAAFSTPHAVVACEAVMVAARPEAFTESFDQPDVPRDRMGMMMEEQAQG